ncbi:unnamed protein product [Caenorhabditis nigoni]
MNTNEPVVPAFQQEGFKTHKPCFLEVAKEECSIAQYNLLSTKYEDFLNVLTTAPPSITPCSDFYFKYNSLKNITRGGNDGWGNGGGRGGNNGGGRGGNDNGGGRGGNGGGRGGNNGGFNNGGGRGGNGGGRSTPGERIANNVLGALLG